MNMPAFSAHSLFVLRAKLESYKNRCQKFLVGSDKGIETILINCEPDALTTTPPRPKRNAKKVKMTFVYTSDKYCTSNLSQLIISYGQDLLSS